MNPKIKYTNKTINDLLVIQPEIFYDFRGENVELYNKNIYNTIFGNISFTIDSFSFSRRRVLRGFHGDTQNYKLIQCLKGDIFFAVIDMRTSSITYNNVDTFYLNDKNRLQVLIPPGCVNAHYCISNECIFSYKLSNNYTDQKDQISVKWNDPKYNIQWPDNNPILSYRDK